MKTNKIAHFVGFHYIIVSQCTVKNIKYIKYFGFPGSLPEAALSISKLDLLFKNKILGKNS